MAILDKLVKPLAMVHVQSADIEKFTPNLNSSSYKLKRQNSATKI
ncbi:hypothetical protein HDF24_09580 [Mucilaginibacter sp. X4EP1]|nr:hypothetical protein [Mucilaginibacter sp. X4EP1]